MQRPTALLRQLLVAEVIQMYLTQQIVAIKAQMRKEQIRILEQITSKEDITITYAWGQKQDQAVFMRKMVDAEGASRAKRTGVVP
nr:hypothetical protein [Bacilli bacterium]